MQALSLISFCAPLVIITLAVVAVLFSFFWVFLPLPRWLSRGMSRIDRSYLSPEVAEKLSRSRRVLVEPTQKGEVVHVLG